MAGDAAFRDVLAAGERGQADGEVFHRQRQQPASPPSISNRTEDIPGDIFLKDLICPHFE